MHNCQVERGVVGEGNPHAEVIIVGISPGQQEWRDKQPFVGPSGKLLNGLLKWPAQIAREDCWLTNLVCWHTDEPNKAEIAACRPRLIDEILMVKPKLIICLGKIVTESLMPFALGFGKARGGVWRDSIAGHECWFLSTYHPAAYTRKDSGVTITDGVRDFKKIPYILNWKPDHADVKYVTVQSVQAVNGLILGMYSLSEETVLAADVETRYDGSEMLSIAFSFGHDATYHVPYHLMKGPDWQQLSNIKARWTFHNGMFDVEQIRNHLGVNLPIIEDTMLQSYSLDERGGQDVEVDSAGYERSVGIHGLKRLAREYCAAGYYDSKHVLSSNHERSELDPEFDGAPIEQLTPAELAEYNSKDAAYTWRLQQLFEQWQIEDNVRDMYKTLLIPGANALSEIHEYGAHVDRNQLVKLAETWIPEYLELDEQLHQEAIELGWPEDTTPLNLNTWQHLHKFVYDINKHKLIPGQGRTTKKDVLEQFALEESPLGRWCGKLLEWRGRGKDCSTWIDKLDTAMDANHYIHPEPLIHGASNGRTAIHNPPMQTVGKARTIGEERAGGLRRLFSAPDGSIIIEADYSQAELWCAALVSDDDNMLADLTEPFEDGSKADFHRRLTITAFGIDIHDVDEVTWDRYRNSSKAFAFGGILYGGGVDILTGKHYIGKAQPNLYFIKDPKRAAEIIANAEARYYKFYAWREAEKQYAITNGEQISRSGRKRRYYQFNDYRQLNQVGNFPISSISHDHLFMSLTELHYLLKEFDAHIWYEVHDSLVIQCPKQYLDEVASLVNKVMTKPRFGFKRGIPVDFKVGLNWYDLTKYTPKLELAI